MGAFQIHGTRQGQINISTKTATLKCHHPSRPLSIPTFSPAYAMYKSAVRFPPVCTGMLIQNVCLLSRHRLNGITWNGLVCDDMFAFKISFHTFVSRVDAKGDVSQPKAKHRTESVIAFFGRLKPSRVIFISGIHISLSCHSLTVRTLLDIYSKSTLPHRLNSMKNAAENLHRK